MEVVKLKKRITKSLLVFLIVSILIVSLAAVSMAAYPERDVRVIIPWSVGGMTDVLTRPITNWLEDYFGVPFVVENKPGGGGVVGSMVIENSENDGYVIGTTSMSTVSAKYVSPVYPEMENVDLIAQVITIPATVTVNADSPWQTIEEYIEYVKENPGEVKNSNSGTGASAHIYAKVFEHEAGLELNHIPYPAYAEAITALVGGHVDSTNIPLPDVAPQVEAGELRMLAIAADERHPDFPDVPTLKEKGINMSIGNYSGFVAPKGVDPEKIQKIEEGIEKAMQDEEIRNFLIEAGFQPIYKDSEDFAKTVQDATDRLEYLINEVGVEFVDD
jgi:tripartite-type tricarboxylate transporter receptor subunit TctC